MSDLHSSIICKMKELFSTIPYLRGERIILKKIGPEDRDALFELANDPAVAKYLPTFLFENQYQDIDEMIEKLYSECLEESLFLGIYLEGDFCGIIELYGYKPEIHKISIGCRMLEKAWGKGIAVEATKLIVDYLYSEKPIEIITASAMVDNKGSNRALEKAGFTMVAADVEEDWGYPEPTHANKWIC